MKFFVYHFSGKQFNPALFVGDSESAFKNTTRRLIINSTAGGIYRKILKFECRVI